MTPKARQLLFSVEIMSNTDVWMKRRVRRAPRGEAEPNTGQEGLQKKEGE